jgi:ferrochelatase
VAFDAVLLLSFGGPEGPEEVMPFLHNVLRGRPVSPERLEQVAGHYLDFGGVSPINAQNRALRDALSAALVERGTPLPVYWGNRNWKPFLVDALRAMRDDGVARAAAFVTSAYSSYSGCRQYLDDIDSARAEVGAGSPEIVKLRPFFNHPGFIGPLADGLRAARREAGPEAPILMTAHSIPSAAAATCSYEQELRETARLVASRAGEGGSEWSLTYQSRSGPAAQPWLEPDINDALAALPDSTPAAIVVPIGFVSDHMEVVYDLDRQATETAGNRGIKLIRSATPGTHADFVRMICQLIDEVDQPGSEALALGGLGPAPCPCRPGCCPGPARR